jgi:hypothetical protein
MSLSLISVSKRKTVPAGRIVVYLILGTSWVSFFDPLDVLVGYREEARVLSILKDRIFFLISAAIILHLICQQVIGSGSSQENNPCQRSGP